MWIFMSLILLMSGLMEMVSWSSKTPSEINEERAIVAVVVVALSGLSLFIGILYESMKPNSQSSQPRVNLAPRNRVAKQTAQASTAPPKSVYF